MNTFLFGSWEKFKRQTTGKFSTVKDRIVSLLGGWEKFKRSINNRNIFSQWKKERIDFLLNWDDMLCITKFPSLNIKQVGWFFYWSLGKLRIENLFNFPAFLSFLSCISSFFLADLLYIFYYILSGFSCLLRIHVYRLCIYIMIMSLQIHCDMSFPVIKSIRFLTFWVGSCLLLNKTIPFDSHVS